MLEWEHFSLWTEKALNLYVKPGTRFFVGGHKVCRLEHKSAFSLWPCSHPLIIISSYKTKYSQLLHQGFVGISCEQSLAVPCSAHSSVLTLSGPSSGYRLCLREEGSVSVSGDITESVTHCHGTLSFLTPAWLFPQFSLLLSITTANPQVVNRDVKDNGIFPATLCLKWSEASCLRLFLQTWQVAMD